MTERSRNRLLALLVGLVGLLALISIFSSSFFPIKSDETYLAWVGKEAAHGLVPYGDYFTYFPPMTIYLVAFVFKSFGTSLAALRIFTVLWLSGVGVVLFRLLRRGGLSAAWSAGAALLFPLLYLPYWPVPSHHWFALGFGLSALLVGLRAREDGAPALWFSAGILASLSGLCLQTEGALCCLVLAMLFLTSPRSERRGRDAAWALTGVGLPILLMTAILALHGALNWAVYDLVVWPASFYKRPGGFNDVDAFSFLLTMARERLPASLGIHGWGPLATFLAALTLPVLALFLPAFSPHWTSPGRRPSARWIWTVTTVILTFMVYLKGRADWIHLICYLPFLLFAVVHNIDWRVERWRPRIFKAWVIAGLAVACFQWPQILLTHPPLFDHVASIDRDVRSHSSPAVLSLLPDAVEKRLPILCLPDGSSLYFFWEPVAPPMGWVMLPSAAVEAPWEYRKLAAFARENRVPYILIRDAYVDGFLREPSALSDLLQTEYRPFKRTPLGTLFARTDYAPAP